MTMVVIVFFGLGVENAEALFQSMQEAAVVEADEYGQHDKSNCARPGAPEQRWKVEKARKRVLIAGHNGFYFS